MAIFGDVHVEQASVARTPPVECIENNTCEIMKKNEEKKWTSSPLESAEC